MSFSLNSSTFCQLNAWRFHCITAYAHRNRRAPAEKIGAPARPTENGIAKDTRGGQQARDDGGIKRTAGEAGLGIPSSSNRREGHDGTQQRHASQEGSDGPMLKRAKVQAPGIPAGGGTDTVALPSPQVGEVNSSSAAAQAPEVCSKAAASEVDFQAAQQVIADILHDCRQSRGLCQAAKSGEAVQAVGAGPAGVEQDRAGGAAEGQPGSMANGGQRRVGRILKTARKPHAPPRMAGAPKPKPKPGRKMGSANMSAPCGQTAGSMPKAKARKSTQRAQGHSKAAGEASVGDATAEASSLREAVAEVLDGPSEETIAQADLKYKLTTPHQAGVIL